MTGVFLLFAYVPAFQTVPEPAGATPPVGEGALTSQMGGALTQPEPAGQ
jgi:hypothetical protein